MALVDETCLRLLEGQWLDMGFESRLDVGLSEYLDMISLKTGALLGCAAELGALLAFEDDADGRLPALRAQPRARVPDPRRRPRHLGRRATRRASRRAATFGARRSHFPSSAPFKTRHRRRKSCGGSTAQPQIDEEQVATVLDLLDSLGVREATRRTAEDYRDRALAEIGVAPAAAGRARRPRRAGALPGEPLALKDRR